MKLTIENLKQLIQESISIGDDKDVAIDIDAKAAQMALDSYMSILSDTYNDDIDNMLSEEGYSRPEDMITYYKSIFIKRLKNPSA